jgi:UPF0042 nucleotide-binding protein
MKLILISGLSGSGKSIALNVLADAGYYCVDNLPATLLFDVVNFLEDAGQSRIAVAVDARSAALSALPETVARLKAQGIDCRVLFLDASRESLMRRFSETRRRHPLTSSGSGLTLAEAIEQERAMLAGAADLGHHIDTSDLQPKALRDWIRALLEIGRGPVTLLFESFSYSQGIPLDAGTASSNPNYAEALAYYESRAIPQAYGWSWRNAQLEKDVYIRTIGRSNDAYRRATTDLVALIANHLLSAVDAFASVRLIQAAGGELRVSASVPFR